MSNLANKLPQKPHIVIPKKSYPLKLEAIAKSLLKPISISQKSHLLDYYNYIFSINHLIHKKVSVHFFGIFLD